MSSNRTWHNPEDRKPLTRKQIAELFLRQDGKCPNCSQKLHMKGHRMMGVDEHLEPLWRGGSNDLSNRELWCKPCTAPKTAREAGERAKALSMRDKHIGAVKRQGRPLMGSKASGWKKGFDGRAIRRDAE